MVMEPGESLVGSYLRYVEGCELVLHNTFAGEQAEIDVIGIKPADSLVILCEVATHIRGLNYGQGNVDTLNRLDHKIGRARRFADRTFPDEQHRYEIWSPVVPKGILTSGFDDLMAKHETAGVKVVFVVNEEYTTRVQALLDRARQDAGATGEPAYRLLQILTRLRGQLNL